MLFLNDCIFVGITIVLQTNKEIKFLYQRYFRFYAKFMLHFWYVGTSKKNYFIYRISNQQSIIL